MAAEALNPSIDIPEQISKELKLTGSQVRSVLALFEEGCTVPFIARYRKEATGSLDETVITAIRDRSGRMAELEKRRAAILESLAERELLTDELRNSVLEARTLTALEDVYLPWRPKRRTRASIAAEKGLRPLADLLLAQSETLDPSSAARPFVDEAKGVASAEEAMAGAMDILAERFSEDPEARQETRRLFARKAVLSSSCVKGKEEEGANYRDYFDWREPASAMPSHRVLAILRGEREGFLSLSAVPPEEEALSILKRRFVRGTGPASRLVAEAAEDGYRRLLRSSMENELRGALKKRADAEAIRVFAANVREVLMSAPMGQRATLAIDPGIRTGCKVVCLDPQGNLLYDTVIYLHASERQREAAAETLRSLVGRYAIEAIAVGNGTAGRETESFVRGLGLPPEVVVASVNESGASIYSASEAARREFPDHDVTVRGAVSIGRRLMDPMAELVKIDPKSIGVGQYQHDVDQKELKQALDDVVIHCVNAVGVNVNTASPEILSYVSGLNRQVVAQIVKYREANGPFPSREAMRKVPRLGPKTYEQSIGFLRVLGGENPLDASAVHPENYGTVGRMAQALSCTVGDLMTSPELRARIEPERFVSDTAGLPTLRDILQELEKPGRDPRAAFEVFAFDPDVHEIKDLRAGQVLPGIVTNVTAFGAFVDIGVHQDGLVHVSRIADTFVENPQAHLKPGQKVRAAVLEVDEPRRRISLSLRKSDLGEGDGRAARGSGSPATRRRRERDDKPDLSMGSILREQLEGTETERAAPRSRRRKG